MGSAGSSVERPRAEAMVRAGSARGPLASMSVPAKRHQIEPFVDAASFALAAQMQTMVVAGLHSLGRRRRAQLRGTTRSDPTRAITAGSPQSSSLTRARSS
jgi:hypothetical protein